MVFEAGNQFDMAISQFEKALFDLGFIQLADLRLLQKQHLRWSSWHHPQLVIQSLVTGRLPTIDVE